MYFVCFILLLKVFLIVSPILTKTINNLDFSTFKVGNSL